jgi:hypothetical protein
MVKGTEEQYDSALRKIKDISLEILRDIKDLWYKVREAGLIQYLVEWAHVVRQFCQGE